MSSPTSNQCVEFLRNPDVNPVTGRKITKGKSTYNKLMVKCIENNIPSPRPKSFKVPSMGPMIHWKHNIENTSELIKNMNDFLKYIRDKVKTYETNVTESLSKMELMDFIDILNEARVIFANDTRYNKGISYHIDKINMFLSTRDIINDIPKYNIIAEMEIKPGRKVVRENVAFIYSLYKSAKRTMNFAVNKNEIFADITKGHLRDICNSKEYLDYVIKHKIFTYEDIYEKTFPNEQVFEELKRLHVEYAKVYKRLKGKSP